MLQQSFSVRWKGYVRVPRDESYIFHIIVDPPSPIVNIRLFLNGTKVIDAIPTSSLTSSIPFYLEYDSFNALVLELSLRPMQDLPTLKLVWSSLSNQFDIIPATAFYHTYPSIDHVASPMPIQISPGSVSPMSCFAIGESLYHQIANVAATFRVFIRDQFGNPRGLDTKTIRVSAIPVGKSLTDGSTREVLGHFVVVDEEKGEYDVTITIALSGKHVLTVVIGPSLDAHIRGSPFVVEVVPEPVVSSSETLVVGAKLPSFSVGDDIVLQTTLRDKSLNPIPIHVLQQLVKKQCPTCDSLVHQLKVELTLLEQANGRPPNTPILVLCQIRASDSNPIGLIEHKCTPLISGKYHLHVTLPAFLTDFPSKDVMARVHLAESPYLLTVSHIAAIVSNTRIWGDCITISSVEAVEDQAIQKCSVPHFSIDILARDAFKNNASLQLQQYSVWAQPLNDFAVDLGKKLSYFASVRPFANTGFMTGEKANDGRHHATFYIDNPGKYHVYVLMVDSLWDGQGKGLQTSYFANSWHTGEPTLQNIRGIHTHRRIHILYRDQVIPSMSGEFHFPHTSATWEGYLRCPSTKGQVSLQFQIRSTYLSKVSLFLAGFPVPLQLVNHNEEQDTEIWTKVDIWESFKDNVVFPPASVVPVKLLYSFSLPKQKFGHIEAIDHTIEMLWKVQESQEFRQDFIIGAFPLGLGHYSAIPIQFLYPKAEVFNKTILIDLD